MVGKIPSADLARKTGWFATQRACNTEMIPKIYININIFKKCFTSLLKKNPLCLAKSAIKAGCHGLA